MENKNNNAAVSCASPQGLEGIATLTHDPLATYTLHGGVSRKRGSHFRLPLSWVLYVGYYRNNYAACRMAP